MDQTLLQAVVALVHLLGWKSVTLLHEGDTFFEGELCNILRSELTHRRSNLVRLSPLCGMNHEVATFVQHVNKGKFKTIMGWGGFICQCRCWEVRSHG